MTTVPTVLHGARVFVGPGDRLFGFDRIWVLIHRGAQYVYGRHGNDKRDEELLAHVLDYPDKDAAYSEAHGILEGRSESYYDRPAPVLRGRDAALKGDSPPVWTIDFDQDRVFFDQDGRHLTYQFIYHEIRPSRLLRLFQPYTPMQLPIMRTQTASSLAAAPRNVIPQQLFDLTYRMATDYERNWREANYTIERCGLQQIAMGLLSCFTLNFTTMRIVPLNIHLHPYLGQAEPRNLLRWRTWPSPQVVPTVSLGATQILFTERMDQAASLVHEHFTSAATTDPRNHDSYDYDSDMSYYDYDGNYISSSAHHNAPKVRKIHYIVTSIREIQYFCKTLDTISCTPVIPFFDGTTPPSETGVRWLLNAIHAHAYPLRTHFDTLSVPLELQEMILDYASDTLFDRAVYASVLNIGIPFAWKEGAFLLKCSKMGHGRKLDVTKAEYHIWFWGDYVGLTYQADGGGPYRIVERSKLKIWIY
ncbi:hypothetical protein P153DRAFT_127388 [Dothidotthia symphoricarpi CBS 119687]|uniref:Uncharacterized protein n=1 Tax=Dothidotthia symphoricarpi CBS 119687 TaxID=1392245 RepID=A0A6A5ZZT7_9PLEO|nr:uncharacterized protein P153DRAFT_127388 [Dothidotthia symphoricarpi CBS 119687]KAF2124796.1 hypothetical protein P153DRAFT_127388 [Dothidotthia symphoricarpi CBS 119687]